ncbi:xanthine dehydrogenase YagS FAD-binding subunit [Mucilaginibacter lappiensis]|uniref:Xanthine dehydrogenase YagS FAD-binding subunit n=1 Tax=Mucilaginibacter lappiensis TaxID=354630 RepID=A0ABR6PHH9_9SPHI|nr:xanthine dehydrogenase family protein subunit M [Mucilaginibacter lappiensis]MBB6108465.1 xanthine dehydrogenase YagS FAD-binding subunit [Mucilaginibacter lappiensis]SIQ36949.1 xanthine dehydrogenase YagS FAD-binding subunit [Mucilaginibacter lappiensis]
MKQFQYVQPATQQAVLEVINKPGTKIIAGGTNLVDLMKRGVTAPDKLVDINHLPLKHITSTPKGLYIGALALNSVVSENKLVAEKQPLLAMALKSGASPQLRNMASVGGNMMQRTRCGYFYDTAMPCNKRVPGSGCGAYEGVNRMHAIFGASSQCIAVHPSDMCVALAALDAVVIIAGKKGEHRVPFTEFHRLPGDHPETDNNLPFGELIVGVEIPNNNLQKNSYYLKVRDRQSYAFALVSVAAALDIENGIIQNARLAMGGVAHKPWRLFDAEKLLIGKKASEESFQQAAQLAMQGAKAYGHNSFKLKLAPASITEALKHAAGLV